MKKMFLAAACSALIYSCNKKTDETKISDVTKDSMHINKSDIEIEAIPLFCYVGNVGKDSVKLKLSDNLGTITGNMAYKNFEKDSSHGEVIGFYESDTLKLDYMFKAEGTESSREIWFLKSGNDLIEGIGEQDQYGKYTNPKAIKFEGGHVLKSTDCKNFKATL